MFRSVSVPFVCIQVETNHESCFLLTSMSMGYHIIVHAAFAAVCTETNTKSYIMLTSVLCIQHDKSVSK